MTAWKLLDCTGPRIYERPLGLTELGFYWDGRFNGTADTLQNAMVEIIDPEKQHLFSVENVTRTWLALKQQFPLLGAYLVDRKEGTDVAFTVTEDRLAFSGPEEIYFQTVSSLAEAQTFADNVIHGKRSLSGELLARLVILPRSDQISHVHVLIHVAHCITDGVANTTLLRSFLDVISSEPISTKWDLHERLTLALASEDLVPTPLSNRAKRRWHRAMGQVLSSNRVGKITGGHTLPRKFTKLVPFRPAHSGLTTISFSQEESRQILQTCRENGVTFGNAYPVLAQVALARVLCRRYIRGEINDDEWEYRKKEPMTTGGPLSLRPFLDRGWFERGGASNLSLSIGFFSQTLPFMPLGSASNIKPGDTLPEIDKFLSFPRFLLRCCLIRQQSARLINHPLFLDITTSRSLSNIERLRMVATQWQAKRNETDNNIISTVNQGPVWTHGGSSFGNMDVILPRDYPLSRADSSAPTLHLHTNRNLLRCRPAELYLGASTTLQQLHLAVFWDMNVFDDETVEEWLQEVHDATAFFLGMKRGAEKPTMARL